MDNLDLQYEIEKKHDLDDQIKDLTIYKKSLDNYMKVLMVNDIIGCAAVTLNIRYDPTSYLIPSILGASTLLSIGATGMIMKERRTIINELKKYRKVLNSLNIVTENFIDVDENEKEKIKKYKSEKS